MRVLLTGCGGYIGSRLAARLRCQGHHVVGLDRVPCAGVPVDEFIQCDLLETARYSEALNRTDHICHLAAAKGDWGISEAEYYRDNLEATRALIAAAREADIRRWIFYSTVSTLGPSDVPLAEDAPRRPANPYGASKAACEELYEEYVDQTDGVQVTIIRPSVVFGPGNPWNTNIFRLIDAIYRKRFLMIGKGDQVKTTSYIDNLLDAHMFLMERQISQESSGTDIYHYVDAPGDATATLIGRIYDCLHMKPGNHRLPLPVAAPLAVIGDVAAAVTGIDMPITRARVRKFCTATNFSAQAIRDLGFKQSIGNKEAIAYTVDWYLDTYRPRARMA